MLSLLVEPVYLSSVTVGGGCPYSERALRRALVDRSADGDRSSEDGRRRPLQLMRSSLEFEYAKHHADVAHSKPCPSSVVWWRGDPVINDEGGTG